MQAPTVPSGAGQQIFAIEIDGDVVRDFGKKIGWPASSVQSQQRELLRAIAATVSRSPAGRKLEACYVVRGGLRPALGLLGAFDPADRARIEILGAELPSRLDELRFVGYSDAAAACEILGQRLLDRVGRERLETARFEAIPRGGHIVLGMLAMVLGLRSEQLEPPTEVDERLTVVIDDSALTGHRFGRWLEASAARKVVFATLFAPVELSAAVECAEPERVLACVTAHELRDRGPERYGADYPQWQRSWAEVLDQPRYVVGDHEPLAFAWKEPDQSLWNPVTARREPGWRCLPSEVCLGNRTTGGLPATVQLQPMAAGPLRLAEDVIFADIDGCIILGSTEGGEAVSFDGVAADMWRTMIEQGDTARTVAVLRGQYDVDELQLETDVIAFLEMLRERGWVVERDGPQRPAG